MIRECYLPKHKEIKVFQDDDLFKINTDTEVLGEFINIYKEDTVLDMGTNTGALMLYANLFNPKKIIGLEINKKALELAKKNLDINGVNNYELIEGNIITYENDPVDVIICNPPYFKYEKDSILNKNDVKSIARHEISIKLEDIFRIAKKLLKNGGSIYLIHRTDRLIEIIEKMKENNIEPKKIRFIYPKINKESNLVLIEGKKNGKIGLKLLSPLIVHNEDGSYTDEVLKMFGK